MGELEKLKKENEFLKSIVEQFKNGYEDYITFENDSKLRSLFHTVDK